MSIPITRRQSFYIHYCASESDARVMALRQIDAGRKVEIHQAQVFQVVQAIDLAQPRVTTNQAGRWCVLSWSAA